MRHENNSGQSITWSKKPRSLVWVIVMAVIAALVFWQVSAWMSSLSVPVLARAIGKGIEDAKLCARIERYMHAVVQRDENTALTLWVIPDQPSPGIQLDRLVERRYTITHNLLASNISPTFEIKNIELWHTACCDSGPGVTNDYQWAAGARVQVDLIIENSWETYIFDVFNDGIHAEPEHWVIRDVYPPSQEPLFWRLRSHVQQLDSFP